MQQDSGGIINIVSKKDKRRGLNGTMNCVIRTGYLPQGQW